MSENIVIGSFEWDTTKVTHAIATNKQEIERLKNEIEKSKKSMKEATSVMGEMEARLNSEHKAQARLNEQLKKGYITQGEYTQKMKKSNEAIDRFVIAQNNAQKAQANQIIAINKSEQAVKELNLQNNELNKLLKAGNDTMHESSGAYRKLDQQLSSLRIQTRDMGAELLNLKKSGKENTDEFKLLEKQYDANQKKTIELANEIKKLDKAVGDNQRSVGDYRDQIKGAFSEIFVGFKQIQHGNISEGFNTIKGSIKGVTASIRQLWVAMMSNPLTAVLAVISAVAGGIGLSIREMMKYNEMLANENRLTEQITGLQGKALDELTIKTQAMEKVLGLNRKKTLESSAAIANEFKISHQEALKAIEDGAIRGGALNEKFLDSLAQYPSFFAKAGFSAKEFARVINKGYDGGVYSDKLQEAIKQFDLSIREQTKITRNALTNAFGAVFTDDILNRVSKGKTTVKDALIEISKESEKYHLSEKQQAQLTAGLFKKAGKDAGGFAEIINKVTMAIDEQNTGLTETQKIIQRQLDDYDELGKAKNDALKSDSILAFQRHMERLWVRIKIIWYEGVQYVMKYIELWRVNFMSFIDLMRKSPDIISIAFKGIKQDLINLAKAGYLLGKALKDAFSLDMDSAKKSFSEMENLLSNAFKGTKKAHAEIGNIIRTTYAGNLKKVQESDKANADAQRALDKANKPDNDFDGSANAKSKKPKKEKAKKDDTAKKLEAEAKKALELERERAQQAIEIAKVELAEYIRINAEKYKNDKRLTDEKLRLQNEYFKEVQKKQLELLSLEENSKKLAVRQKIDELNSKKNLSNNEVTELANLKNQLLIIERDFSEQRNKLEDETNEKITETTKKHNEQFAEQKKLARAVEYQTRLIELEEQNANEFERQSAQLENETQNKLQEWAKQNEIKLEMDNDNYISQQEIDNARKELQAEIQDTNDENERLRLANQLNALNNIQEEYANNSRKIEEMKNEAIATSYSDMFGNIATLLGKNTEAGKAAAITQATINTYKGISEVWGAKSTLPEPMATVSKIINSGVVLANGLNTVKQITAVDISKVKSKAQRGMLIEGASHSQGGVPVRTPHGMIEAEGGEVIINKISSRLFRDELSAINVAGGGVRFAKGGVLPSKIPTVQQSLKKNNQNITLDSNAVQQIAEAIYHGSQSGISDLSNNRNVVKDANF